VHGARIKRSWLESGRDYYTMAADWLLGELLANRLAGAGNPPEPGRVRELLDSATVSEDTSWVDVCGMVTPAAELARVLGHVRDGRIAGVEQFHAAMRELHGCSARLAWNWCAAVLEQRSGTPVRSFSGRQLAAVAQRMRDAASTLLGMAEMDLGREFDQSAMTGYGADGGPEERERDFEAVRGSPDTNAVAALLESRREKVEQYCTAIERCAALFG
jgi:hypothetical protein